MRALVAAVAEGFCVRVAAAAERDRVARLVGPAVGVEKSGSSLDEVGAVVGGCDRGLVHRCSWMSLRARPGGAAGALRCGSTGVSDRGVGREVRGSRSR